MTLLSSLMGPALGYGKRTTRKLAIDRRIEAPMRDGIVLLADRYRPAHLDRGPVVLVRSPYGRDFLGGMLWGRLYAERGYQVLIQSVRGTHGSGGEFKAVSQEHEDGVDTLEWLRAQPWCDGRIAMIGPSYLGYVQWALGPDAANTLTAMCPQVTSGKLPFFVGGTVALEDLVAWTYGMGELIRGEFSLKTQLRLARSAAGRLPSKVNEAIQQLPTIEAGERLTGRDFWHWRNWLKHLRTDDEWWQDEGGDWRDLAGKYTAPMNLMSGWYDVFLPQQLGDYRAQRAAGQQPYLLVGPWTHGAPGFVRAAGADSLRWLRAHLDGDRAALRSKPVRLFVTGAKEWREFADWPPPSLEEKWYLQPDRALGPVLPTASDPDAFTFNPADPTPSVGGATLGKSAGPRKNNVLESRVDVLTYTSEALDRDVDVIGEVTAELFVTSSAPYTDFFIRICEVDRRGTSTNVTDGIRRVYPEDGLEQEDGTLRLPVDLWPVAHRFRKGHRIRIQVSSGAFPRFARNLGTGEGIEKGDTMVVQRQQVFHDPDRPSSVVLPVTT